MLETLIIENSFAHASKTIDFTQGFTAITGLNGSGKSEILDCIRFAFFGAAALRTNISDYKKLRVQLTCTIKGQSYSITRSCANARVERNGEAIAVGTRPVNAKIIETFGYGMNVFDTANVVRQNKIAAMSEMQPADRKRMVDTTIGLDVIDNIIKWCAEEGKAKASEATGVRFGMVEPVEPVRPEGYVEQDEIVALLQRLRTDWKRAEALKAKIANEPTVGSEPSCIEKRSSDEIKELISQRSAVEAQVHEAQRELNKHGVAPKYSLEELDAFDAQIDLAHSIEQAVEELENPSEPIFTLFDLDDNEKRLHEHDAWKKYQELKAKGGNTCPSCGHFWHYEEEDMKRLGDWEGKPQPRPPLINSLLMIEKLRRDWQKIESRKGQRAHAKMVLEVHGNKPDYPTIHSVEIVSERERHAKDAQRRVWAETHTRLQNQLSFMTDERPALQRRVAYERQLDIYANQLAIHAEWEAACPAWRSELDALGDVEAEMGAASALQASCASYDRLCAAYQTQLLAFQAAQARLAALDTEIDQLGRARAALAAVKARVKTHLVPSLSRVASILLRQMTGGLMNDLSLTNEFDIKVDGKVMDALSGAELAAANLALRIGLGQVLTNRVFSVLMCDEVDKDMDDERAPFAAACLRNLTKTISQVILVSHKRPEADTIIAL